MGEVVPRIAVSAVVLADRSPLPLADIWPPPIPVPGIEQPILQTTESGHPFPLRAHVLSFDIASSRILVA
jgi:hypothetical protein